MLPPLAKWGRSDCTSLFSKFCEVRECIIIFIGRRSTRSNDVFCVEVTRGRGHCGSSATVRSTEVFFCLNSFLILETRSTLVTQNIVQAGLQSIVVFELITSNELLERRLLLQEKLKVKNFLLCPLLGQVWKKDRIFPGLHVKPRKNLSFLFIQSCQKVRENEWCIPCYTTYEILFSCIFPPNPFSIVHTRLSISKPKIRNQT